MHKLCILLIYIISKLIDVQLYVLPVSQTYEVIRGHLSERVHVEGSAVVAPLIFVSSATYGITPKGRKEKLNMISCDINKIALLEHRIGEAKMRPGFDAKLTLEEKELLGRKQALLEERDDFTNMPSAFLDVTMKLQHLVDQVKE